MTYTFLMTSREPGYKRFLEKELEAEIIVQRNYKRAARIACEVDISGIIIPLFHYSTSDRTAKEKIETCMGKELEIPVFEGWRYEPSCENKTLREIEAEVRKEFEKWITSKFMQQASSTLLTLP